MEEAEAADSSAFISFRNYKTSGVYTTAYRKKSAAASTAVHAHGKRRFDFESATRAKKESFHILFAYFSVQKSAAHSKVASDSGFCSDDMKVKTKKYIEAWNKNARVSRRKCSRIKHRLEAGKGRMRACV